MPPEPSVTSACEGPLLCTLRYSSALLPKSFERPGPKSVRPAMYCSGDKEVVRWRWIVDMCSSCSCLQRMRTENGQQAAKLLVIRCEEMLGPNQLLALWTPKSLWKHGGPAPVRSGHGS